MSDRYFENDKVFELPGHYYKEATFHYLNYEYVRSTDVYFTEQTCHLPEGAHLLSVFIGKYMELIENLIIFYWIGDEHNIVAERRILVEQSDGVVVYKYSVPYIENLKEYTASQELPPVFDSPYGRVFKEDRYIRYAESGFNRKVKRVFQFEADGNRTIVLPSKLITIWQPFIVEFFNGDLELAFCRQSHEHLSEHNKGFINYPDYHDNGKPHEKDLARALAFKRLWESNENNHVWVDTCEKREPISTTFWQRLKEWWAEQ